MRRYVAITTLLALGLWSLLPASAESSWELSDGAGWVSGPVEHLTTLTDEAGAAMDMVVHDGYLYVTTWRSFSIYDISDPTDPQRLSSTPLVTGVFGEEPQTNGEILLVSRDYQWPQPGLLDIYDVQDKAAPSLVGRYQTPSGRQDHLWTCVLDCSYAYSATGTILDLRDPTEPTEVGSWRDVANYRAWHHIAEVAPGLVLTGGTPMFVLDASDPENPKQLARIEVPVTRPLVTLSANPHALPARVAWPRDGEDRYAIVSMETPFKGRCTDQAGEVLTFDTTDWQEHKTFTHVGRYQIATNGTYTDGNAPHNVLGCSAYGMDPHPAWGDEHRSAVVTFFEHGIRVLGVDDEGEIAELGGFIPLAGNSTTARWLTDDIVAVTDMHRGIDLLRVQHDGLASTAD